MISILYGEGSMCGVRVLASPPQRYFRTGVLNPGPGEPRAFKANWTTVLLG
uniref:Uncharacterized protein n=1 Tax=Anguilla anguilla TaxID=7936 RepID=A0A0E9T5X8_ANGAN